MRTHFSTAGLITPVSTFSQRSPVEKKIQKNNEAESINAVPGEAHEAYVEEIVIALQSENTNDLQSNVSRIVQWIGALAWQKNQGSD